MKNIDINQLSLNSSEKAILRQFVDAWDSHAQPVLFVGAGLSKHSSVRRAEAPGKSAFGSWNDIMNDFSKRLGCGSFATAKS
jgi:hypothetical protein